MSKEEDARNIISHALGLPVRVTDIQTHRGLHDLEIDLPDGSAETVEVTTLTGTKISSVCTGRRLTS